MAEKPTSGGAGRSGELQVVVCELADEHYGLDIARVFEIIRPSPMPTLIAGVLVLYLTARWASAGSRG